MSEINKEVIIVNKCEYITKCDEVFAWVYNEDVEKMLKHDRKWYLKEKGRKMKLLGFKENKGRGNGSVNYGARNTTVNVDKPSIMTI